ncbi:MAG: porin family protein [Salibacteraceae bacterium]
MLNKCFILLVFVWFSTISVFAQQEAKKTRVGQFSGLVRAGLVASQMYNDDFGGYNKLGGTAGFGISTPISRSGKLQMEMNYAMRGSRKPAKPDDGDFTSILLEAHYIDIPILYKSSIWKFDYEVGLNNGVLIGTRVEYDGGISAPDNRKTFNRYELALNLGVDVPITDLWAFNARFHYSILPAAGKLAFVNGLSLTGGMFHNAITFSFVRTILPKD